MIDDLQIRFEAAKKEVLEAYGALLDAEKEWRLQGNGFQDVKYFNTVLRAKQRHSDAASVWNELVNTTSVTA